MRSGGPNPKGRLPFPQPSRYLDSFDYFDFFHTFDFSRTSLRVLAVISTNTLLRGPQNPAIPQRTFGLCGKGPICLGCRPLDSELECERLAKFEQARASKKYGSLRGGLQPT